MAPVPKNGVLAQYFSHAHPNHPLTRHSDDREYNCHGCKTAGSGVRFRCHACPVAVDMHEYCADCPLELSSFLHNHRLTLVPNLKHRICDICRESLDGMFYRCKDCGFDVHPLCTQLPKELRHSIDDHHKLSLKKLPSGTGSCAVCKIDCSSLWVYGCDLCKVNIHPKCLLKPYGGQRSQIPGLPPSASRGISHAPPPWNANGGFPGGSGYGGGGGGHFPYAAYVSPWGFPNYHFNYPPPPPPQQIYYGSVPFPLNNNPSHYGGHTPPLPSPSPSPSIWGSMIGSAMFSLVENLTAGVITEFIFGSSN